MLKNTIPKILPGYSSDIQTLDHPLFGKALFYAFSRDGCYLAIVDKSYQFTLYLLDDIHSGKIRPFYTDENEYNVTDLTFAELDSLLLESTLLRNYTAGKIKPSLNIKSIAKSFDQIDTQLILSIKNFNSQTNFGKLLVFDLTKKTICADIPIPKEATCMRSDHILKSNIFFIEKDTNNLIKYDFVSATTELISMNTEFYEELDDGSLIISTKEGIKYFDKQTTLRSLSPKGIQPLAFYSLSYQKVLMLGYNVQNCPYFTVFDPLSDKIEPIYSLPYFICRPRTYYFASIGISGNHVFITSSTSKFLVHITANNGLYDMDSIVELPERPKGMTLLKNNKKSLAIFCPNNLTLVNFTKEQLKFNQIAKNETKNIIESEQTTDEEECKDEFLQKTRSLIDMLPRPSDPLSAVNFLKNEADPILDSISSLNDLLSDQMVAVDLSKKLLSKKPWNPSDVEYYSQKIISEKAILQKQIQNFEQRSDKTEGNSQNAKSDQKRQFSFRYSMQTTEFSAGSAEQAGHGKGHIHQKQLGKVPIQKHYMAPNQLSLSGKASEK